MASSFRELISDPVRLVPRALAMAHQISALLHPSHLHFAPPHSEYELAITDSGDNRGAAAASDAQAIEDFYTAIDHVEEFHVPVLDGVSIHLRVPARHLDELRAAGWDEAALGRWLREGLRIRLDRTDGALTEGQLRAFATETPSIFFALVDTSAHLWEHQVVHGGIFMNRALLELKENAGDDSKDNAVADAHLASGFSHELVHRIRRQSASLEAELVAGDAAVVSSILTSQGTVTRRDYLSRVTGLLHETVAVFFARQLEWAWRLANAERDREDARAKMAAVARMEAKQAARRDQIAEQILQLRVEAERIGVAAPAAASMRDRARHTLEQELTRMDQELASLPRIKGDIGSIERRPGSIQERQHFLIHRLLKFLVPEPPDSELGEASQISTVLEVENQNFGTGPPHLAFTVTKTGLKRGEVMAKGAKAIERYYTEHEGLETVPVSLMDGVAIQLRIPMTHRHELQKGGWDDAEIGRLLREGLRIRLEQGGVIDASQIRAFAQDNPTIFFALVDTSTHLWEHHVGHGGIFMNRGLLRLRKQRTRETRRVADAFFASGLSHELVHRILRQGTLIEAALLPGDAAVVAQLLRSAGVSHQVLRPILTGFLHEVSIAFYVRQMVMATRLVRAEEAQRTGVTKRLLALQFRVENLGAAVDNQQTVLKEQRALSELQARQSHRRQHLNLWISRMHEFHAGAVRAGADRRAADWNAYQMSMNEELQLLEQELAAQKEKVVEARQSAGEAVAEPLAEAERLAVEERQAIQDRPDRIRRRQITLVDDLLTGLGHLELAKKILRRIRRDHTVVSVELDTLLAGYCVEALDQITRAGLVGPDPVIHSLADLHQIYRYIDQLAQDYGGRASLAERFAAKGIDGIANVVARYFFYYRLEHEPLPPEPSLRRIDITTIPPTTRNEAFRVLKVIYGESYQTNSDHLRRMANYDVFSLGFLCDLAVKLEISITSLDELIHHVRLVDIAVRTQGDHESLASRLALGRYGTDALVSPLLRLAKRKWDREQADKAQEAALERRVQTKRMLRLILNREAEPAEVDQEVEKIGACHIPTLEHLILRARNESRPFASAEEALGVYQKVVPAIEKRVGGNPIEKIFASDPLTTKHVLNKEYNAACRPASLGAEGHAAALSDEADAKRLLRRIRGDEEVRPAEMRMITSRLGVIDVLEAIVTSAESTGTPVVLVVELMRIYLELDTCSRRLMGSLATLFAQSEKNAITFIDNQLDNARRGTLTAAEKSFASAEIDYRESNRFLHLGSQEAWAGNLAAAKISFQQAATEAEKARTGFTAVKIEKSDQGSEGLAWTVSQRTQSLENALIPELTRRSAILEDLAIVQANRDLLYENEAALLARLEKGEAPTEQDVTDMNAIPPKIEIRKSIRAGLETLQSGAEIETEAVVDRLLYLARILRNNPVELEVYSGTFMERFAERIGDAAVAAPFLLNFLPGGEADALLASREAAALTAPDQFVLCLLDALNRTVPTLGQLTKEKTAIDSERDKAHARLDSALEAMLESDFARLHPLSEEAAIAAERVQRRYKDLVKQAAPMSAEIMAEAEKEAQRIRNAIAGMDRDARDLVQQSVNDILAHGSLIPIPNVVNQQAFEETVVRQEQRLLGDPNHAPMRFFPMYVREAVEASVAERFLAARGKAVQVPRLEPVLPENMTPEEAATQRKSAYKRLGYNFEKPPPTAKIVEEFWRRREEKRTGLNYVAYLRLLSRAS